MIYEQDKWVMRTAARPVLGPETELAGLAKFPVFPQRTSLLSAQRRAAFRAHLEAQVAALAADPLEPVAPAEPAPPTALDTALGAFCARCRGSCCRTAGDHAYIGRATLAATIARTGTADVVEHYLARLPGRSLHASCVFHTTTGCALPRDLRSDTCNRYLCLPLGAIARSSIDEPGRPYIAAFQPDGGDRDVYVVRDMDMQRLPPAPAAAADSVEPAGAAAPSLLD